MTNRNARTLAPKLLAPLAAASALLAGTAAQAEVFGIMNGRTAGAPEQEVSVELALQLDDDLRYIGVRGNYLLQPDMTVFANISQLSFDDNSDADGFEIGGGAFLHLGEQRVAPSIDLALKPAIGIGQVSSGDFDGTIYNLSGEVLASSAEAISSAGLNWYANLGLAIFGSSGDFDDDTDVEPILGGGITLPAGPGTLYAGIDFIDNIQFGAGFRYGLR